MLLLVVVQYHIRARVCELLVFDAGTYGAVLEEPLIPFQCDAGEEVQRYADGVFIVVRVHRISFHISAARLCWAFILFFSRYATVGIYLRNFSSADFASLIGISYTLPSYVIQTFNRYL